MEYLTMIDELEQPKYKAIYHFAGFERTVEVSGEPMHDVGFSIPQPIADMESNKSLSIYFELASFDGKLAIYRLKGWREMQTTLPK